MPRLARFHETHPDVELRVVTSVKPITEAAKHFDVAMKTSGRPSGTARLAFTVEDDVFPVCAPALVPPRNRPLKPSDLGEYPLLSHRVVPQDRMEWSDWFESVGATTGKRPRLVHFDSYPLALQAAVSGRGIALGWRRTTEGMIEEGKLIRPCLEFVSRPDEISVFRGPTRTTHRDADMLVTWLASELTGNPRS